MQIFKDRQSVIHREIMYNLITFQALYKMLQEFKQDRRLSITPNVTKRT